MKKELVHKNSLILRCSLILFSLYWCIVPFFGFAPHHDGLMLSTISLTRNAVIHHTQLPFDQYGSFWIFIYALPATIFPAAWALILSRIITILLYLVSALFILKIAKFIEKPKLGLIALFLAGISHAYGLDPMPWPSSVAIPLLLATTYLLVKILSGANKRRYGIFIGAFCGMLILTRVQVGIAVFAVCLVVLWMHSKCQVPWLALGVTLFITIFGTILASLGWLNQALTDEFLFGYAYIQSSSADKPHPVFTLLLTFIILGFLIITELRFRYSWLACNWNLLFGIFLAGFLFSSILLSVNYIFGTSVGNRSSGIIIHRFWVSFLLAGILYSVAQAVTSFIKSRRKRKVESLEQKITLAIALLAFASEIEIYPLFDPMHAWWSEFPGVISIGILIASRSTTTSLNNYIRNLKVAVLISLVVLTTTPFLQGLNSKFTQLSPSDMTGIFMPNPFQSDFSKVRTFYTKNIERGDSVLNLCPDAGPFFLTDYAKPASRVFLFWDPMLKVSNLRNSIEESDPQVVVLCRTGSHATDSNVKLILHKVKPQASKVASFEISPASAIEIWK
jgi:hypothetical protein